MIPDVSVVIPTFNRVELVERAIGSIDEPELNVEIIVVDDFSTDSTAERLSGRGDIRLIRLPSNGGPGAARNAGIAAARGRHIAFLDSDDERVPRSLVAQVRALDAQPDCILVHGRYRFTGEVAVVGFSTEVDPRPPAVGDIYWELFRFNLIAPSTAVVRAKRLKELGGFDARYRRSEEWDLWLRLCSRAPVGAVDDIVASILTASDDGHASGDPVLIETTSAEVVRRHLSGGDCRQMSSGERLRIYREFCRLRVDQMFWKTLARRPRAHARLRLRCLLACLALAPLYVLTPANLKNTVKLLQPG